MKSKYPIPSLAWWQAKGMTLKEIPVSKKDLKRLSKEEKSIAAIATFPFLKKALIKSAIAFALILIGVLAVVISGATTDSALGVGFFVLIACIVISFVVSINASALINGFDIIEGSSILGLPIWFRLVKFALSGPTMTLGALGCMILQVLNRWNQAKMLGMPRIALPQNGAFEDFIRYYSDYEDKVNAQAPLQSFSHYTLPQVEEKIRECKATIKEIQNDTTLTQSEKEVEISKWKKMLSDYEELRDKLSGNL